jgi:glycosyltransferase involved in cell wall biosynthesis
MTQPKVSIVLCTRNRADYLTKTLNHYQEIATDVSWELVVVDNGSSDETTTIVSEFSRQSAIQLRLTYEARAGLSRARNAGWRAAAGEIIAFTDDDCYPRPDFVTEVWRNFVESEISYLGGRVVLYDAQDYPITIQLCERRIEIAPGSFIQAGQIHGANIAARRTTIQTLGGFDEMLGAGAPIPSGEDVDFVSRASAAGYWGAYDPRPVVFHHHRRRTKNQVSSLEFSYDLGRGAYYMKCILDKARRRKAIKAWYWSVRGNIRNLNRHPRSILGNLIEIEGAIGFLIRHIIRQVRKAAGGILR